MGEFGFARFTRFADIRDICTWESGESRRCDSPNSLCKPVIALQVCRANRSKYHEHTYTQIGQIYTCIFVMFAQFALQIDD